MRKAVHTLASLVVVAVLLFKIRVMTSLCLPWDQNGNGIYRYCIAHECWKAVGMMKSAICAVEKHNNVKSQKLKEVKHTVAV